MSFDHAIFYATENGGIMRVMWGDRDTYERIKKTGFLPDAPNGISQAVHMVAFATVDECYDFMLERAR